MTRLSDRLGLVRNPARWYHANWTTEVSIPVGGLMLGNGCMSLVALPPRRSKQRLGHPAILGVVNVRRAILGRA